MILKNANSTNLLGFNTPPLLLTFAALALPLLQSLEGYCCSHWTWQRFCETKTTDRVTKEKEWVSQKKKKTFDKLTSPLRHSLWVSSLCRSSAVPSLRTSLGGFCFSGSFSPLWFHRTGNHWKLCRLLEIKSARFDVGLAVWLKYSNGLSWCNPADTAATHHAWPWPNSVSITKFHP